MITFVKMIRTFFVVLIALIGSFTTNSQTTYYFGLSLMPSYQGVVSYGIVGVQDGKVLGTEAVPVQDWVRMNAGEITSRANPKRKNLFEEYKVDSCWVLYDSIYWTYGKKKYVGYECIPMNNLWKLRYQTHPYDYDNQEPGWSKTPFSPSIEQMEFLRDGYGITHLDAFVWGENMYRLLNDMNNRLWVDAYRAGITYEAYIDDENDAEGEDAEVVEPVDD